MRQQRQHLQRGGHVTPQPVGKIAVSAEHLDAGHQRPDALIAVRPREGDSRLELRARDSAH